MRILLDHCVPRRFGRLIPGHDAVTARRMGWDELRNGALLTAAEVEGFTVLLTVDKNLRYQQSLGGRRIAIVTLDALFTTRPGLLPLLPALVEALAQIGPGEFVVIRPED